jgi:hypothetical protein
VAGDELRQRFEMLEAEMLPLAKSPAVGTIRRWGRRRQRTVRAAVLVPAVLIAALVARGVEDARPRPWVGPVAPVPTTQPAPVPLTTAAPPTSAVPPTTVAPPTTTAPSTTAAAAARVELRPDGLGAVGFGTGEREALDRLEHRLGAPDERGAWRGATPFGTCPGPVRAVRWGRLYVLFTSGPTRYEAGGRWHLFTYQVDAVRRTAIDPDYNGPSPPPDPPPLRGPSPRTAAGIGFGSTLAELRRAYGRRLQVSVGEPTMAYQFRIDFGAAGELSGSLSGGTPGATITFLAAGALCGE